MTAIFVTASGTDIGKTEVCCRLIRELGLGDRLRAIKPIVTGWDPDRPALSDTGRLLEAQGLPLSADQIDRTSPWRFLAALSPDMAAAREDREVPFDSVVACCKDPDPGVTLIEGIGGVMVPLDPERTVLDWIAALDPVVLLVVGSYLGSLSHSLTALSALRARKLNVAALVISESMEQPVAAAETASVLKRFADNLPVQILPRSATATPETALIAPLLSRYLVAGKR